MATISDHVSLLRAIRAQECRCVVAPNVRCVHMATRKRDRFYDQLSAGYVATMLDGRTQEAAELLRAGKPLPGNLRDIDYAARWLNQALRESEPEQLELALY